MGKTTSINLVGRDEFEVIMGVFARCTDDYLFLFDLDKDEYIISEKILEKFDLPGNHFFHAGTILEKVVYPEDMPELSADLEKLKSGMSQEHNMEYRWVDREYKIVWISCRGVVIQDRTQEQKTKILIGRISEIGRASCRERV